MDTNTIITLATVLVTYICGVIAKKHPKINNKLIPIQNLLIGLIVATVNYIITKDFSASIVVAGLMTGGAYDLGKNITELIKKGE